MKIKIKKLDKSDWKQYKEIRLEALKNDPSAFGSSYYEESKRNDEDWQKKFENIGSAESNKFYYAAQIEEKFVAIGGAFQDENKEWNIIAIYTKPDNRGIGIGAKLLTRIINELKTRKIFKVFLKVNMNPSRILYMAVFTAKLTAILLSYDFSQSYFSNSEMVR